MAYTTNGLIEDQIEALQGVREELEKLKRITAQLTSQSKEQTLENQALRADLKKWEKWGLSNDLPPAKPLELWVNYAPAYQMHMGYNTLVQACNAQHGNDGGLIAPPKLFREVL